MQRLILVNYSLYGRVSVITPRYCLRMELGVSANSVVPPDRFLNSSNKPVDSNAVERGF
jgi:hypothetical protein